MDITLYSLIQQKIQQSTDIKVYPTGTVVPSPRPMEDRIESGDRMADLPFWEVGRFGTRGYKLWSSQTNDLKIDTCHFLARHSTLLG